MLKKKRFDTQFDHQKSMSNEPENFSGMSPRDEDANLAKILGTFDNMPKKHRIYNPSTT